MSPRIKKGLILFLLLDLVSCIGIPVTPNQPSLTKISNITPTPFQIQATEQASPYPPPLPATATVPSLPSIIPSALPSATSFPTPDLPARLPIGHLHMFDAKHGSTVHDKQVPQQPNDILMTSSGALSWNNVSPVLPKGDYQGPVVSFADNSHGIAMYVYNKDRASFPTDVLTWRTTDWGYTWQSGGALEVHAALIYARQIILDTAQHGWFFLQDASLRVSPVFLFETQDGGIHWNLTYNTNQSNSSSEDELWAEYNAFGDMLFTFYTPTNGYFSSGGLFATQDGGRSWHRQYLPTPAEIPDLEDQLLHMKLTDTLSTPQFSSATDGVLIHRVYDRSKVELMSGYTILPEQEYLYFTHDGGLTWTSQPSPAKIGTVFFLDVKQGWYVGKSDTDPGALPQVYQTQDGGAHWSILDSSNPPPLGSEILFVDDQNGFANSLQGSYYRTFDPRSGTEPQLFITKDGGRTWEKTDFKLLP